MIVLLQLVGMKEKNMNEKNDDGVAAKSITKRKE